MKRLFIAINLPEDTKREIKNIVSQIKINADVRWTPPENWHLTVTFLGYQPEETIEQILKSIKETINSLVLFKGPEQKLKIEFDKIILAPPGKLSQPPKFFEEKLWRPRMIWLAGTKKTSEKLATIKNYLEESLIKNGVRFKRENRGYNAHLTLARFSIPIRNYENIRKYEKELLNCQITQLPISFIAQSLDLMESHLNPFGKLRVDAEQGQSIKRAGAEYEVLKKLTFLQK